MDLSKIYSARPEWAYKGNYGSVLIVGGSKLYSGAPTLTSVSCLRVGADLVTLCAPERAANVAVQTKPDLITFPLKGDFLTSKHIVDILDTAHVRKINSVVIGCGLGRHALTILAVQKLLVKITVPMVLDADALRAISEKPEILQGKYAVLTPHLGELAVLLKKDKIEEDFEEKLQAAKEAAVKYQSVVLLKGHVDIITDGRTTITNNSGTPYMTKGGFGDCLAGIVGALLARGVGMMEAAHVGAYICGRAGELAAEDKGEGLLASDIWDYMGKAINGSL